MIKQHQQVEKTSIIGLLVVIIAAAILPPLIFVVLYFCFQHSPRHMINHMAYFKSPFIITNCLILTLVTLLVSAYYFFSLEGFNQSERLVKIVFIGLAALTVPHMILVESSIFKSNRLKNERYT